jgi:hypothetical protein
MQDARGAILDVLEEIIHEGAEVRFVLSDDVKHRLAEKHAARRAQHTSTMVDILQRNPGAEIRLPKYMFDHVMAALRSGTPVKFDA